MDTSGEFEVSPPKRLKRPDLQKIALAKENVERGKEHKTASGNIVPAKLFELQVICKCGESCCNKIDVCRQKEIFESYYLGNWSQKTLLLRSSIKKTSVSLRRSEYNPIIPLKAKQFNFQYSLIDEKGISQKVCRDFFMKCLKVTPKRMYSAVNSSLTNPNAFEMRGQAPSINKTSEEDRMNVINFINLFPKYESHYSRTVSQKKYLNPNLNMMKLYAEYKISCDIKTINVVSLSIFRSIFKNSFNLSFKHRHSDTCKTCDHFACLLKSDSPKEEKKDIEDKKDKHMTLVEKTNSEFKQDVKEATESHKLSVLTFDLQKTLETPSLTTSVAYYKRQLWTYNLCIYDEVEKKENFVPTPDDWIQIIKTSKKSEPKFNVKKMDVENFFSSSNLERLIINRKKDITGEKVKWFHVRKIFQYKKKVFELIFFNELSTQVVNLGKRSTSSNDFRSTSLELLYPLGKKITKSKFMDLMHLKTFIPNESRNFYNNLIFEDSTNTDYGIASDSSGDEH